MKKWIVTLLLGAFVIPCFGGLAARAETVELTDNKTTELLVEVGSGESLPKDAEILSSHEDTYLISMPSEKAAKQVVERLPNASYNVPFVVMDELVPEPVELDLNGPVAETALDELGTALEESEPQPYSRRARVAVLDTGCREGGISMLGDDGVDRNGHGAWMIDEIMALAPDAEILSVKALNDQGYGDAATIYAAIKYAMEQNVDIIHMSFAGYAVESCTPIENLLKEASGRGILLVGAAGNYNADGKNFLPGKCAEVYTIGAADPYGVRMPMSNYGDCVDYLVTANTTSEAAARFTGHLANGEDVGEAIGEWVWIPEKEIFDPPAPMADGFYIQAPAQSYTGLLSVTDQGYDYLMLGDDLSINPSDFSGTGGWHVEHISLDTGGGPAMRYAVVNDCAYNVAELGDTVAHAIPGSFTLRFRNAAKDGNGNFYDLIMTVNNIWQKANASGNGIVALVEDEGTVWFGAATKTSAAGHLLGLRYDVCYKLVNAGTNTPINGLMMMAFKDLDQPGIGRPTIMHGSTQGYDYAESIKLRSGVAGSVYLERGSLLINGDGGFSYIANGSTGGGNQPPESMSGISFLGLTTGTYFTWAATSGYTAMTADIAVPNYTITPSKEGPGSITPSSAVTVPAGMSRAFTMKADANCRIKSVSIDGTAVTVTNEDEMTYKFSNVHANHTIHVVFEPKSRQVTTYIRHQDVNGNWSAYSVKDQQTINYGGSYSYTWVRGSGEPENIYYDASPNPTTADNVTEDKSLYMDVARKKYTYAFNFNPPGSHAVSEITNRQGDKTNWWAETMSGTAKNPGLTGYTFLGWNTKTDGTGSAWANEKMLSNKTFYARWKTNQYKVKYDGNGSSNPGHLPGEFTQNTVTSASGMPASTFTYDTKGTLRTNDFKREGYEFIGWNTKADGTGTSYPDKYDNVLNWASTDGAEITLYAQWKKKLGTETLTVVSEETGNPVPGVTVQLYKKVNGTWEALGSPKTTGADGTVNAPDLHWFDYEWRSVSVPNGYQGMSNVDFQITYNHLSKEDVRILYMKHVVLTLDSVVTDIISGENPPAFLYHVEGTDVAGVSHAYDVLVQTGPDGTGTKTAPDLFAGTWTVTQILVSRYVPGTAENVKASTINGINGTANLITAAEAEIRFPYTIKQYGGFGSMDSETNILQK